MGPSPSSSLSSDSSIPSLSPSSPSSPSDSSSSPPSSSFSSPSDTSLSSSFPFIFFQFFLQFFTTSLFLFTLCFIISNDITQQILIHKTNHFYTSNTVQQKFTFFLNRIFFFDYFTDISS